MQNCHHEPASSGAQFTVMKFVHAAALCFAMCTSAVAQTFDAGFETLQDRLRYHFDNDSKWDTTFLVPHFFDQVYSGDKQLLVLRARGRDWSVEAGVSGVRQLAGSDYDTFFQPDGDVVVHGHMLDVDARSWRAAFRMNVAGPWHMRVGFSRDQFHHPPGFSVTLHTQPPSSLATFSDSRENVVSNILEAAVGVTHTKPMGRSFRLRGSVDVAPVALAQLSTYLPDKYSGPVRFTATSYALLGSLTAEWQIGRAVLAITGEGGHAWPYSPKASFTRELSGITASIGWAHP